MSAKSLAVRPLPDTDRERWANLAAAHGTVFESLRWTDLHGQSLKRYGIYDGGGLRGGFFAFEQRAFGLRVLREAPYTPLVGPFYDARASNAAARTDERRAFVEAMAEFLNTLNAPLISLTLPAGMTDCLPFYWRGWKVVPRYTYRVDLNRPDTAILGAMSTDRRKAIRKAVEDGVTVTASSDMSLMRSLSSHSYARHNKRFPRGVMDRILDAYSPGPESYCFVSSVQHRPVAGVFVVHDRKTAYYLLGGYAEGSHHGAGALAIWTAMLRAKELGLDVFDFEGSNVAPIERYFRGFGGQLTPVFSVHKAWLPLEMGLKLRLRSYF